MTLTVLGCVARVPTAHAKRALKLLCDHWKHRFSVEQGAERGLVQIPRDARGAEWPGDGLIMLIAGVVDLEVRIEASCQDQLDAIKSAVSRHLGRFLGHEGALTMDWKQGQTA